MECCCRIVYTSTVSIYRKEGHEIEAYTICSGGSGGGGGGGGGSGGSGGGSYILAMTLSFMWYHFLRRRL